MAFTYALACRLEGSGVTTNVLHPGVVRTNFGREDTPWMWRLMFPLISPFLLTPEQGAETSIYLSTSVEVAGATGKYYVKKKAVRSNPVSYDQGVQDRLWDLSAQMTNYA